MYAEIPAQDYVEISHPFRIVLIAYPVYPEHWAEEYEDASKALPVQTLMPALGKHVYRACCNTLAVTEHNRGLKYCDTHGWFKSDTPCWTGKLLTNEVTLNVVRK